VHFITSLLTSGSHKRSTKTSNCSYSDESCYTGSTQRSLNMKRCAYSTTRSHRDHLEDGEIRDIYHGRMLVAPSAETHGEKNSQQSTWQVTIDEPL
jgi:hypothetical protein